MALATCLTWLLFVCKYVDARRSIGKEIHLDTLFSNTCAYKITKELDDQISKPFSFLGRIERLAIELATKAKNAHQGRRDRIRTVLFNSHVANLREDLVQLGWHGRQSIARQTQFV
jgi:hypothetical protein